MGQTQRSNSKVKSPIVWPLVLIVAGVILVANNFILLGNLNIINLSPLLLVLIGVWILLRGDITPSNNSKTFGITRGSVESATLDIRSGEIDISISMLPIANQERLITFHNYPVQSRPELKVDGVHTQLNMYRSHTPWFSFTDWDVSIAHNLPWQLLLTSHIGQVHVDLTDGIVSNVKLATSIANIHMHTPYEALEDIYVTSILGTIHITTPVGHASKIAVNSGRFTNLYVDETRYLLDDNGNYFSKDNDDEAPLVIVTVASTFSDIYLS